MALGTLCSQASQITEDSKLGKIGHNACAGSCRLTRDDQRLNITMQSNTSTSKGGSWTSSQWYSEQRLGAVPRYWRPGKDGFVTHLAYITEQEIQLLKKQAKKSGSPLVMRQGPAGVPFFATADINVSNMNGEGKAAKNVPVRWKSSPDHPMARLVYVTDEQAEFLKKMDIHDSGVDEHDHYGPDNVPSYQGDGGGGDGSGDGGGGDGGDGGGGDGGDSVGSDATSGLDGLSSAEAGQAEAGAVADADAAAAADALGGLSSAEVGEAETAAVNDALAAEGEASAAVGQAELDAVNAALASMSKDSGLSLGNLTAKDVLSAIAMAKSGPLGLAMAGLSLAGKASGDKGFGQAAQGLGIMGNLAAGNVMGALASGLSMAGYGQAAQGMGLANAIASGNPIGALSAGLNMAGQNQAAQGVNAMGALASGNTLGAMASLAGLVGSGGNLGATGSGAGSTDFAGGDSGGGSGMETTTTATPGTGSTTTGGGFDALTAALIGSLGMGSARGDRGAQVPWLDTSPEMLKNEIVVKNDPLANLDPALLEVLADKGYGTQSPILMASGGLASGGTTSIYDICKYAPKFAREDEDQFLRTVISSRRTPMALKQLRHLKESISPLGNMGALAAGGLPKKYHEAAPAGHRPEFVTGLTGYYADGRGTGQSDDIPAMLHDGDYVMDAETVSALGDGSSKAGRQVLDGFRTQIPHSAKSGGSVVPAKIADGEYVFPESFVTALGQGDNKRGAKVLDGLREKLREHKRSAPLNKIPPKAKSPLDYIKAAKG